ncbi:MAG: YcaO-like family protein [Verrucomicrobiota bacterium]
MRDAGSFRASVSGGSTPKVIRKGTHRAHDLDRTLARVLALAPVMGITRVANVTGLDPIGIPVVMVCRPNSRSVAVSQGKGIDLPSARVSGLMEAAELYHAETITLPLRAANYEELRYKFKVADPDTLARTAPSSFHPNLNILWCEGRELFQDEELLVPYELVHTNYTLPIFHGHGCFVASSNGLASGNHLAEAISHGICEVVERDATTLWKLRGKARISTSRLDLGSVDDPTSQRLLEKLQDAGMAVAVWDVTSDIGLATFVCYIVPANEGMMWHSAAAAGYGCHPSREIAFARAVTEAAQSRLTVVSGQRDDFGREAYDHQLDPDLVTAIRTNAGTVRFDQVAHWEGDTFEEDIEHQLERLRRVGIRQVIVSDLTKTEFDLPVVRVVIPGLESMLLDTYSPGVRGRNFLERQTA